MSASDCLAPPLHNQTEKDIVKSYGGWTAFCHSMGLKPFNPEDNAEAYYILRSLAADEEAEQAKNTNKSKHKNNA